MAENNTQRAQTPSAAAVQAAQTSSAKSRNTVTVGCRLLHGIGIRLYEMGETQDGKPIMKESGPIVWLNGANKSALFNGVGFTDVDAEFWEAWSAQNKNFDPLRSGMIFAQPKELDALAHARELSGEKTGFEALDPDKPGERLGDKRLQKMDAKDAA